MCRKRALQAILWIFSLILVSGILLVGGVGAYIYYDQDLSFARRQFDRLVNSDVVSGGPINNAPAVQTDPTLDPLLAESEGSNTLSIAINNSGPTHAISPLIYGINFSDEETLIELNIPVRRWGGNATTRYSWEYDISNRASDWFFQNFPSDNPERDALPFGSSADQYVQFNQSQGIDTIMTIPMLGWAPIDGEFRCAFSVQKYGAQQYSDPYNGDCGNGVYPDGQVVAGNDPSDTSKEIDPSYVQAWVSHLNGQFGDAANGGVRLYNLDNEPMLWHETHRDVYPNPVNYVDIRDRTYAYAAALKATDPAAETLGPVAWGWSVYFESALDLEESVPLLPGPDRSEHGEPFVEWYLGEMKAYEDQNGLRILDYLDLHYYPAHANVALSGAVDPVTQELRLRSTRSLWDPEYVDESWIGEPVRLIPRMRDWVNTEYPGTKLAITEYNFGALGHINGALAQADVLGIFGREQLDLATLWDPPTLDQPAAYAIRMYRNYDGNNSTFGDESFKTISQNQDLVSAYAASRSADGAMTIMVINKTGVTQPVSIKLVEALPAGQTAELYRYSADNLSEITTLSDLIVGQEDLTLELPGESINLIVLK